MLTEKKQQNFGFGCFLFVWFLPSHEEWSSPVKLMFYPWGPERLQRFCREAGKTWIYWPTWTHCMSHRCSFLLKKVLFLSNNKLQHLFLFLPQGHVGEPGNPGTKVMLQRHCVYKLGQYQSICIQTLNIFITFLQGAKGIQGIQGVKGAQVRHFVLSTPDHIRLVFYWTRLCLF